MLFLMLCILHRFCTCMLSYTMETTTSFQFDIIGSLFPSIFSSLQFRTFVDVLNNVFITFAFILAAGHWSQTLSFFSLLVLFFLPYIFCMLFFIVQTHAWWMDHDKKLYIVKDTLDHYISFPHLTTFDPSLHNKHPQIRRDIFEETDRKFNLELNFCQNLYKFTFFEWFFFQTRVQMINTFNFFTDNKFK